MQKFIPSGFDGNHISNIFATYSLADSFSEERWEVDEIADRIFKRLISRKICRPVDYSTEQDLFHRYKGGDSSARDSLVFANLRLVNSVARKFRPHQLTCNDIISEGCIGLLKAIDGYDVESTFRFATYAYKTIYYHIHNFLKVSNSSISFPLTVLSYRNRYIDFCKSFFQEYLSSPPDSEVARALNIPLVTAKGIRECFDEPISIDLLCEQLGYDYVMYDLLDEIADIDHDYIDSSLRPQSLYTDIIGSFSLLKDKEADILRMSFGIGSPIMTLEEIGMKFDLTRERVRQIREKAIRKLRIKYGLPLREYLG